MSHSSQFIISYHTKFHSTLLFQLIQRNTYQYNSQRYFWCMKTHLMKSERNFVKFVCASYFSRTRVSLVLAADGRTEWQYGTYAKADEGITAEALQKSYLVKKTVRRDYNHSHASRYYINPWIIPTVRQIYKPIRSLCRNTHFHNMNLCLLKYVHETQCVAYRVLAHNPFLSLIFSIISFFIPIYYNKVLIS